MLCALTLAAGGAYGDKKAKVGPVSIDADKEKLVVLRTDGGHFVVIEPFNTRSDHFYFGDGKNMYRQRTFSGSQDGTVKFSRSYWAPRVASNASIDFKDGAWNLECADRKTPLSEVTGDDAAKVLDKGKYHTELWKRQAYHLSRDDHGRYYYVDRLRDEHGGKGYRLFIGMKGKMPLTKLTNIVSDSEGDIFSTKKGDLRFIIDNGESKDVTWLKGKTKTVLRPVPLYKNIILIYDELGVYEGEDFGTACDYY